MTRSRRRELAAAMVAAVVSFYALVAPAGAQTPTAASAPKSAHSVVLRRVDSAEQAKTTVAFQYDGDAKDVSSLKLTENAKAVTPTVAAAPLASVGLVIVVDASQSTDKTAVLDQTRNAVKALTAGLPAGTQMAVVVAGRDAALVQSFTADPAVIDKQIGLATPSGDGALWEGVARAAAQFKGSALLPNILLVTDGETGKGTTFGDAKGAVLEVGAEVFAIGIQGGKLGGEAHELATTTGGPYQESAKASDISSFVNGFKAALTGQYQLTYASAGASGVNDIELSVSDATAKGTFVAGSLASGAQELAFQAPGGSLSFFQKDSAKLLGVVLGLLAAGLGAFAIISLVVKDETGLAGVLQPYSEGYVANAEDDDDAPDQGMAQTALMQRAVELTHQFAERQGFLTKVEGALERANLPLRAAEAMFFYAAAAAIVGLLALGLSRNLIVFVVVLAMAVLIPPAVLNFLANRRKKQFNALLPDTLQLLSGTLRAGYSMMQGVEAVSQEVAEPMGRELRRVVTESRLGRPLEVSLDGVAERMDSGDFAWAVMAIRIQREVGGNLSELLMTVAQTMTQRERLRRDVSTLTAEGRVSAYVLGILPIGLGAAMLALNPKYMDPLFENGLGNFLLGAGIAMMLIGFVWMNKLVKVEI